MPKNHKENCPCCICRAKRGGYVGKGNPSYGKHHSNEHIEKIGKSCSKTHKKKWQEDVEYRERQIAAHNTKEYIEKRCQIMKEKWQDSKWREKQLRVIFKKWKMGPNKSEKKLEEIIDEILPGEFKYVGNGDFWITSEGKHLNPDFVNVNNQKKIIELYGDYWHSEKVTGQIKIEEENQRINHFAKFGYKTLIIWEHELKDIKQLKKKILVFNRK